MALEETDPNYQQNLQPLVLTEPATINISLDEQMQITTQENLLPDIELLPRDELAIYGYRISHLSASHIFKAASPPDKNEETD
ncbi:6215_t:CDS:1, partial [Cetraspora pellucida]